MISELNPKNCFVGLKQVKKAMLVSKAEKVFIAEDIDPMLIETIVSMCEQNGVLTERVETSKELGECCGISVKASCACILK